MKNTQTIQGILSIAALACMLIGWLNVFTPEINDFLYRKLFYILIGISFVLQAKSLTDQRMVFPMYIAAALCIVGALLPESMNLSYLKTAGLFGGVILSFINRPKQVRN